MAQPENWALTKGEWEVLSDLLDERPLSWSKVVFQQGAALGVPDKPGIYLICSRPASSLGGDDAPSLLNMLYVGMSDSSIRDRFKSHLSAAAKEPMKAARRLFGNYLEFYYCLADPPGVYEKRIYDAFGPPINAKSPPGMTARLGTARKL